MPNSLKVRIKKLEHDGKIDTEECDALLNKLEGHDAKVRADAIEEFVEKANEEIYKDFNFADVGEYSINDVALTLYRVEEKLKGGAE